MKNFYKNKKILITGHTGFQGAWLTQILIGLEAEVVGLSLEPHTEPNLFTIFGLNKSITNYFLDIRELEVLKKVFEDEKPEIVFHLAAQAIVLDGYERPIDTYTTNVIGTANILEAVRFVPSVKSVVIVTTDKVYENKEEDYAYKEDDKLNGYDPYSASKAAADIITQSYIRSFFNPETNDALAAYIGIARSGNVVGGGDWGNHRLIPDMVRSVFHECAEMVLRNPSAVRPWQHVFEPLSGYLVLAKGLFERQKNLVGAWNFGPTDESSLPVEEVIKRFVDSLGHGTYRVESNNDRHEAGLLKLDNTKARCALKWEPKLSLDQCLALTAEWYRMYYSQDEDIIALSDKHIKSFFNFSI